MRESAPAVLEGLDAIGESGVSILALPRDSPRAPEETAATNASQQALFDTLVRLAGDRALKT